jgi:hypothetical protein
MDGPGYVVESRLGRGGMGVVDLALAPDGSHVALKRIALHGSADALAAARARIRREAEVLGRLDHRRIVGLLDVVDDGDDIVLVMPWMQGGSLADRVAASGPVPADEADRIADHLLGALAAAHRAGVVHRDIKPANILFDEQSRPHLADFGVATARDVTAGLTMAGGAVGTAGFLAPEQARGEVAGPAADVFSLGASLRWAVTGAGPYGDGDRDVLLWRASRAKVDLCPRTVPEPLRRRIDAMLDPRPAKRPTAAALAPGPDGTAEARPARPRGHRGRRRAVVAVGGATVLALAIGGVLLLDGPDDGADPATGSSADSSTTCVPLPFQPCGQPAAPGTDGQACIDDRADYDGDPANGCEALPDELDGTPLGAVDPTIVPAADTDEFPVEVADNFHLTCDGHITFDLTAPPGMALRLEIRSDGGDLLGETTSADGVASRLRVDEPQCAGDDSTTLTAVVRPVGSDRSAEPYRLERAGNW